MSDILFEMKGVRKYFESRATTAERLLSLAGKSSQIGFCVLLMVLISVSGKVRFLGW